VALGGGILAIDVDSDDPAMEAALIGALPPALVKKRGRKGWTAFYRDPSRAIRGRKFCSDKSPRSTLVEILAHGNQTVIPPSIHPSTDQPYVWLTERTLENTRPDELPAVPAELVNQVQGALAPWIGKSAHCFERQH
jgi:hypothetical protein